VTSITLGGVVIVIRPRWSSIAESAGPRLVGRIAERRRDVTTALRDRK
jgi:hypothetical protein